ncbi:MAG: nucleotidyltransferase family protein, partial [Methanobacteriota archaeon]
MNHVESTYSISVVLLAAGQSVRMGKHNKLLLPFRNATILEATLSAFLSVKFSEIVIVLGHEADTLISILQKYPVKTVVNEDYRSGMGTSVATGVAATAVDTQGILICPGDLPLLTSDTVKLLCDVFLEHQPPLIVYPTYQNQQGHPVIFSAEFRPELQKLSGDRG